MKFYLVCFLKIHSRSSARLFGRRTEFRWNERVLMIGPYGTKNPCM